MAMPGRVKGSLSSLRVVNWFPLDDGEPGNGTPGLGVMPSVQPPPLPSVALSPRAVEMPLVIHSTAPNHKINSSNFFPSHMIETMLSLGNPYQMRFMSSCVGRGLSEG